MLERMGRVALRLDHLIRDLLSYSVIAREDVALEAVELDPLVEHVISHYPYLARARPRIRGPLGRARAQPSLLLQALANLLDNAIRYVPRDRVPDVEVWAERRGDGKVRLAVRDNGPGIPRDAWERVFEPFVSLARDDDTGTGIGLAIVKKAVERMGGRVLLESEPGRGSLFWIELEEA
jgi:signal transduction histidine kinase